MDQSQKRIKFHNKLVDILGSNNVYWQPPSNIKLSYPCLIYTLNGMKKLTSNDKNYLYIRSYKVVIVANTSSKCYEIMDNLINNLTMVQYATNYSSDNLYHIVLNIYEQ